jgi:hypothetical protein
MYDSYFIATVTTDDLGLGSDSMIFHKVSSKAAFAEIERFYLDEFVPHLNATTPCEWVLRSLDKKYAYSAAEMECDGEFDLLFENGEFKWASIAA